MKLKVKVCLVDPSIRAQELVDDVLALDTTHALVAHLGALTFDEEVEEIDDVRSWLPVLDKVDDVLKEYLPYVVLVTDSEEQLAQKQAQLEAAKDLINPTWVVMNLLKFLRMLLKTGKEKRCFLSYEHLSTMLGAVNLEIVEEVSWVLFNVSTPAYSISSFTVQEIDLKESIELPNSVSTKAMSIFEGLGMFSADYGIFDFIRGHGPSGISLESKEVEITFPKSAASKKDTFALGKVNSDESEKVEVSLVLKYVNEVDLLCHLPNTPKSTQLQIQCDTAILQGLKMPQIECRGVEVDVISFYRAVKALDSDKETRARVVGLRLQALYMLIHSKSPWDRIAPLIAKGSTFLKELVALADMQNEDVLALNLNTPYELCTIALECVTGLLERTYRRRGSNLISGIQDELGLSKHTSRESVEGSWTAVVFTCCRISGNLFEKLSAKDVDINHKSHAVIGTYIRVGMELFITALNARDEAHSVADMPVVGSVLGVLSIAKGAVTKLLNESAAANAKDNRVVPLTVLHTQIVWTVAKYFTCFLSCVDKPGYNNNVRECDGMTIVAEYIELFAEACEKSESILLDNCSKNILECAFEILSAQLEFARREHYYVNNDNAQTGVHVLHTNAFAQLSRQVFSSPYSKNEYLWIEILNLLRGGIRIEPTFLQMFLDSDYIKPLFSEFKPGAASMQPDAKKVDILIPNIARLAYAMSITNAGQEFLLEQKVVPCIIESCVRPQLLLPRSEGLKQEGFNKCARYLSNTMRDYMTVFGRVIKTCLKGTLNTVCDEVIGVADVLQKANSAMHELESTRMQALFKLTNICILLDRTFFDNKRAAADLLYGDILDEVTLGKLLNCYALILPPPDQLLAQTSLRQDGAPSPGYQPAAKALNTVIRLACPNRSKDLLPNLFSTINEKLSNISEAKSALRACRVAFKASQGDIDSVPPLNEKEDMPDDMSRPGTNHRLRRRSRGGSYGGEGTKVLIVGVLDHVPHKCCFDKNIEEEMNDEMKICLWKFQSNILHLEWLVVILGTCLRPAQRYATSLGPAIVNGRDCLRRISAFHRSSLLEVCRFASKRWNKKPISSCNDRPSLQDGFAYFDSTEDETSIERVPTLYRLRIVSNNGALIREKVEIEGSRVVFLASEGSTVDAYERGRTQAGIVRYRTEHGWLSECRRDKDRDPIVELMFMSKEVVPDNLSQREKMEKLHEESAVHRRLSEALTLRESVCATMSRLHSSLRGLIVGLSRAVVCEANTGVRGGVNRGNILSPSAPALSGLLSKVVKGFLAHPMGCLRDDSQASSLSLIRDGVLKMKSQSNLGPKLAVDETLQKHGNKSESCGHSPSPLARKEEAKDEIIIINKHVGKGRRDSNRAARDQVRDSLHFSGNSKSNTGEEDSHQKEDLQIDVPTLCLYIAGVLKHAIQPAVEDRNGNLNTHFLRTFMFHSGLDVLLDAFYFVCATLYDAIGEASEIKSTTLSASGSCAVFAMFSSLSFLRKLCAKDAFNKSPISALMVSLSDDMGTWDTAKAAKAMTYEFTTRLQPIFAKKLLAGFPADIQGQWLFLLGDLLKLLNFPKAPVTFTTNSSPVRSIHPSGIGSLQAHEWLNVSHCGSVVPPPLSSTSADFGPIDVLSSRPGRGLIAGVERLAISPIPGSAAGVQVQQETQTFEVSEQLVEYLVQLSFPRDEVVRAIMATRSNEATAVVDYLMSFSAINPIPPDAQTDESPASPSGGSSAPLTVSEDTVSLPDSSPADSPAQVLDTGLVHGTSSLQEMPRAPGIEVLSFESLVRDALLGEADASANDEIMAGIQMSSEFLSESSPYPPPLPPPALPSTARTISSGNSESSIEPGSDSRPGTSGRITNTGRTGSSRGSRGASNRDKRNTKGGNKDSVEARKREKEDESLQQRQQMQQLMKLRLMASEVDQYLLPNFLTLCEEKVCCIQDDYQETSLRILLPSVVQFIGNMDKIESKSRWSYMDYMACLVTILEAGCKHRNKNLGAVLMAMICFLRSDAARAFLQFHSEFSRDFATRIVTVLQVELKKEIELNIGTPSGAADIDCKYKWPKWFTQAFIILSELLAWKVPYARFKREEGAEKEMEEGEKSSTSLFVSDFEQPSRLVDAHHFEDIYACAVQVLTNEVILSGDMALSVLMTLSALTTHQNIANTFVMDGGLTKVLSLSSKSINSDAAPVLSIIVQSCLETQVEIRQNMIKAIRAFWKKQKDANPVYPYDGIPLSTFTKFCIPFLQSKPNDFSAALLSCVRLVAIPEQEKNHDTAAAASKQKDMNEKFVVHLLKKSVQEKLQLADLISLKAQNAAAHKDLVDLDSRATRTLLILVDHLKESFASLQKNEKFPAHYVMDALSDAALTICRFPQLVAKGGLSFSSSTSITDLVLQRVFPLTSVLEVESKSADYEDLAERVCRMHSSCRMLTVLTTLKGSPRQMVLDSLLQNLRLCSLGTKQIKAKGPELWVGFSYAMKDVVASRQTEVWELARVKTIIHLSKLITVVMKSTKNHSTDENPKDMDRQVQVSVDTIQQLIFKGVCDALTEALSNVPLSSRLASDAIDAILEPVELMVRPKLQLHLQNIRSNSKDNGDCTEIPGTRDSFDAMSPRRTNVLDLTNFDERASMNQWTVEVEHEAEEHDEWYDERYYNEDERNMGRLEENDDDDSDDDEEGDDGDHEDGGDSPTVDEDNGVNPFRPAGLPPGRESYSALVEDDEDLDEGFVLAESNNQNNNTANNPPGSQQRAWEQLFQQSGNIPPRLPPQPTPNTANVNAGFRMEATPVGAGAVYVTPPDRIREDPLQFVLSQLGNDDTWETRPDSPEAMIVNIIRSSITGQSMPARVIVASAGAGSNSAISNNAHTAYLNGYILPNGIRGAMHVERPSLLHPLLREIAEPPPGTGREGDASRGSRPWMDNNASSRWGLDRDDNLGGSPRANRGYETIGEAMMANMPGISTPAVYPRGNHGGAMGSSVSNAANPGRVRIGELDWDLGELFQESLSAAALSNFDVASMETIRTYRCTHATCHETFPTAQHAATHSTAENCALIREAGEAAAAAAAERERLEEEETARLAEEERARQEEAAVAAAAEAERLHLEEEEERQRYEEESAAAELTEAAGAQATAQAEEEGVTGAVATDQTAESGVQSAPEPNSSSLVCPPGYDEEVFNSLPDFMQQEILDQHAVTADDDTTRQLAEAAGYDMETFMALPDMIRQELLDQARREHPDIAPSSESMADPSNAQEMDNASFLISLAPELRSEVLLTADADFLSTLPPELLAEAQMHRERASQRWRRNSGGNDEGSPRTQQQRTMDGEVAAGSDSDWAGDLSLASASARRGMSGLMVVPMDDLKETIVPPSLLIVIVKVVLATRVPVSFHLVKCLLLNMCRHGDMRDAVLQLLGAIVTKQQSLIDSLMSRPFMASAASIGSLDIKSCIAESRNIATGAFAGEPMVPVLKSKNEVSSSAAEDASAEGEDKNTTAMMLHRIITVLAHLVTDNNAIKYDLLAPRDIKSAELLGSDVPNQFSSPSGSLLETFVSLLTYEVVQSQEFTLTTMTQLIADITEPLEKLPATDVGYQSIQGPEHLNIAKTKLKKKNLSVRRVPLVTLSEQSLCSLCDVLRSELCPRQVFDNVQNSISRLSKVKGNARTIAGLLHDVVQDLGQQSRNCLEEYNEYLNKAEASKQRLSPSKLPQMSSAAKHHERFYRALQTLSLLATQTERKLVDFVSMQDLANIWCALEDTISRLSLYLISDCGDQGSGSSMPSSRAAPQSALTSLMLRMLPLIEAFVMLHSCDIKLAADEKGDEEKEGKEADEEKQTEGEGYESVTGGGSALSPPQGVAYADPALNAPGAEHRDTVEYRNMNASLYPNLVADDREGEGNKSPGGAAGLQRSPSMQMSRSGILGIPGFARVNSMQKTSSYSSMLSFSMPPNVDPVIFRAHNLLLFIQNHAGILNLIIKNKPQLLESSLDVLVKVPQLRLYLTFENKRHYFLSQLKARNKDTARRRTGPHLQVRRNTVFEDSFQNLRWRSAEDYKGKLHVQFYGEEGVDAGGLTREWFMMLSKEIFNPNYCLFTVAADGATFQPYAKSGINPDHLLYFKFVGRIIGKAICDGHLMDAHFTKSFYKHIIGIPVDFTDVEAIDPDYFKNLKQILQYSLEDIGLELTMSVEDLQFGKHTITDLVPNGRHVDVDDNNKVEYVRLVAHHRMTTAIRQQIAAFLEGFYDLVPPALISIFSPPELELLICGLPEVDLDDLFANTDYHSYQPLDKQIQWFWEIIRSLDTEKKNKFLHFVTGTSKVPLEGFKSLQGMRGIQKFNIHRVFGDTSLLPSAHTCFNQLDLPAYETKEELTEKLMLAINEGSEGFGFA